MMRWLKDKKKEKRSNSTSQIDDNKEDDYGFGKEKAVTKSPSSRRQLPPTPATPEEKSPHIYEEIPDLPLNCIPENERALLQSKFGKIKNGFTVTAGAMPESLSVASKSGCSEKEEISPYMIVPVDNEVRQTPTDFHRNGTPEVHCDVIVKDTHCEILLTRKPKVGVFRLDNPGLSVTGENDGDKRSIRNNTHFCSRDRRASSYVQSAGNLSSAFSATSSGFSSSSTSKIHSGGASSLTLGHLFEPLETCEENDCDRTGENGVITYSTGSNFIPRATKLAFNPLPGKNPCKEAFGSDSSDELHRVGYSSIKGDDLGPGGASFASSRDHQSGSKCVTYATVEFHDDLEPSIESQVTYSSVQDQHFTSSKTKSIYSSDGHHHSQFNLKQPKGLANSSNDNSYGGTPRTGIIRPISPSNSANCIYALVTFPTEPKHYNTIADVTATYFPENGSCIEDGFMKDSLGVVYSTINGPFSTDNSSPPCSGGTGDNRTNYEVVSPSTTSFQLSEAKGKLSKTACFNFNDRMQSGFNVDSIRFDPNNRNYRGVVDNPVLKNCRDTAGSIQQGICSKVNTEFDTSSGRENSIQLEFCFCSDEHSSSCGCPDTKHDQDDDLASVAGAASESPNSCRSCGRLIRQITYSESYSDETYDHVYSSRLLIRTGRRFSSPDITFSEASNSEFHDIQNKHHLDFPYPVSRDDSWASTRNSDILPPPYSATMESKVLNTINHVTQFKHETCVDEFDCSYNTSGLREQMQCQFISPKLVDPNNSAVSNLVSPFHTLNCPSSGISALTSVKQTNFPRNNESRVPTTENNHIVDNAGKSLLNSTTDESRSLVEPAVDKPIVDKSRKLDSALILEPKSIGFTGLLTKFSRTKSSKSPKLEPTEIVNVCAVLEEKPRPGEPFRCDKDLEEIPDKNTKKLSKFFQRLASKESTKDATDSVMHQEAVQPASAMLVNDVKQAEKSLKCTLENNAALANSQEHCRDEKQNTSLHTGKVTDDATACKSFTAISEQRVVSQTHIFPAKTHNSPPGHSTASAALTNQLLSEPASILDNDVANKSEGLLSNTKPPQFKTDSGDTCYEYDISTSSEGEQTGYEYFLSKVKKTLNLEHEVQHIGDSSFVRRKRLCKRCKNEGRYSTIDDDEYDIADKDGLCPHLAAKFGDMRAMFEDLVVDQRAVILDCLSDYTFSPYSSRGHGHDGYCRECGCEIVNSDSESLTTVCSLLSQQFRMTSPNGQTLSCDSDEGTMADNSCESADENGESKNTSNNNKSHYDGNSSGYDEPKGKSENVGQKPRKKERKDKKSTSSTSAHISTKEAERLSLTLSTTIQKDSPAELSAVHPLKDGKRTTIPSTSSEINRKSILKKNTSTLLSSHSSRHTAGAYSSPGSGTKDDHSNHSRICDISRSRATSLTDKVLQDIYAPLPSKALSLLTSRNYSSPVGLTCTCGRGLHASIATVAAHLATGMTTAPPTVCTMKDNSLMKPSPASLPLCEGDKNVGVVPVRTHSEKDGMNCSEVEEFILSERKDTSKNDQRTKDVRPEKEALVQNGCSPTQKNVESNECPPSQSKPGNRTFRKERSSVPAKEGSPLRDRLPAKQQYEATAESDYSVFASSHREKDNRVQILLPHPTKNSDDSVLNAELTVADSSEYTYSENLYTDIHERSFIELKTDNSKSECTRKQRLKIVALDLLPESVVDGDTTEAGQSHKKLAIQPKRSKVIEKMAKIFEKNSDSTNSNQKFTKITEVIILDSTAEKHSGHKTRLSKKYICDVESQSMASQPHTENNLSSEVSKSVLNSPDTCSKRSFTGTALFNLTRQDNLCGRPENHNLNLNGNSPASDLLTTSKTLRSRSGSRQGKDNETKGKSDNESGRLKHEFKPVKVKTGKVKSLYLTESRLVKQRSPTPSSSSASSSSSSKRKNGHTKHKLSKKSAYRKRSKHRSERSKNSHGKEERTYYYFSSDFSDIDVVEVLNCEPYTTSTSTNTSASNKSALSRKKRSASSDDLLLSSPENGTNLPAQKPNINIEGAEGGFCEQEVYAIPASSSDLRSRKNSNEIDISPHQSPEMTKYRKMKRTDVYKSRKSNNKLLSDLIIRNYDMQVYGNI